jgi:hypothetical protein
LIKKNTGHKNIEAKETMEEEPVLEAVKNQDTEKVTENKEERRKGGRKYRKNYDKKAKMRRNLNDWKDIRRTSKENWGKMSRMGRIKH